MDHAPPSYLGIHNGHWSDRLLPCSNRTPARSVALVRGEFELMRRSVAIGGSLTGSD
jgi:hypothetical protein